MDFTKGGFKKLNNKNCVGFMDIWIEEPPKAGHPAARPIKCWADLVKLCSDKADIILDPFLGSGTTALVAKRLKRNFVGFEISQEYCKIATRRLHIIVKSCLKFDISKREYYFY